MEREIRSLLRGSADLARLVDSRIYYGMQRQGAGFPLIIIQVISDVEPITLDGPSGLAEARLQVDSYAPTYAAAKEVSRSVRTILNGYSGGSIQGVFYGVSRDGRDESATGDPLFRVSQDYDVQFNRTDGGST